MKTDKSLQSSHMVSKPIILYGQPLIPTNYYPSVIFQLITAAYFTFLIYLSLSHTMNNLRVVLYALLYFINQCLTNILILQDSLDDLGLYPLKKMLIMLRLLVKANMLYFLLRLTINTYSLSVTVLLALFCINQLYLPQQKTRSQISWANAPRMNISYLGNGSFSIIKIIQLANPILVYCFSKTLYAQLTQLSILFLIFFSFNLIMASQLRELLWYEESTLFGWKQIIINDFSYSVNGNQIINPQTQYVWNKKQALKGIIMTCSVSLAIENFLLIFQSVKQEICLAIIQTLIIAITAQLIEFILFEEKSLGKKKNLKTKILNFFKRVT